MDHDWGPRVLLFLSKKDFPKKNGISKMFSQELPYTFRGFSTNFGPSDEKGIKVVKKIDKGRVNHKIEIFTAETFFKGYMGLDLAKDITVRDWLVLSEHKLLTVTSGEVFYDDLGLKRVIRRLHYYPKDVWYHLLACQWTRISQEEHFMGRCGELGDEIGSRLVAARLVKDMMKMCFLMEKAYTPFIKWFGTGFDNLKSSKKLKPVLKSVLKSNDWKTRERYLSKAYEFLARKHNSLNITKPLKTKVEYFHDRPFLVINADLFAAEIKRQIKDPAVKAIKSSVGSINQFTDSTDVFNMNTQRFKRIYK
jgi:hypothetical protein